MSFDSFNNLAEEIKSNPDTATIYAENFNSGAQPFDSLSESN